MSEFVFRKAEAGDVPGIMDIINAAKAYFKEVGIPQWQDGYPNATIVDGDIAAGISYVLASPDGGIAGTAVLQLTPEPTYEKIFDGAWLRPAAAGAAIHRIALAPAAKGTGASARFYEGLEKAAIEAGMPSIKVDTHEKNTAMRRYLAKCGFTQCGTVYMADGSPRIAFEKLL